MNHQITHRLVGQLRKRNNGEILFRVIPLGFRIVRPMVISAQELYELEWMNCFSEEDKREIAFAHYCNVTGSQEKATYFPSRKKTLTPYFVLLTCLLIGILSAADHTAVKLISIYLPYRGWTNIPAALLFFPLAYPIVASINENYGYQLSRLSIWGAFVAMLITSMLERFANAIPSATDFNLAKEFHTILHLMGDGISSSLISFLVGEFISTTIITLMKNLRSWYGYLPFRVISGTLLGSIIDSNLFCYLNFSGFYPYSVVFCITINQIIIKSIYDTLSAILLVPLLTTILRKFDPVDYYDFESKLNPFSVKITSR